MIIKFQKLHEQAIIPTQSSIQAAGYDLYSCEDVRMDPGDRVAIPLGFATEIPRDIHGRIESRSGMALRGLVVLTGVIDSDYRGDWKVIMQNFSNETVKIAAGSRVAQCVFRPTVRVAFEVATELNNTSRGAGGFGSSGS